MKYYLSYREKSREIKKSMPFFTVLQAPLGNGYDALSKKNTPPFTFEMPFLMARGQGRGWKAGSAGGEDPMKGRFPSAKGGGKGRAICPPQGRFRPDR